MSIAEKLITVADNTPLVAAAVQAQKGKNLFNFKDAQYSGVCTSRTSADNLIVTTKDNSRYISANFKISDGTELLGKRITIQAKWQVSGANQGAVRLIWTDKDNKSLSLYQFGGVPNGGSATFVIGGKPANAGALCLFLYGNYEAAGSKAGDTVNYRYIQVEIGDTATPYEAYKDPKLYEEALEKAEQIKTAMLQLKEEISYV